MPLLPRTDLLHFAHFCFFETESYSFHSTSFLNTRIRLVDTILSSLSSDPTSPDFILYSRVKAAISVTQALHIDFFETHLQDNLLDLVSSAYHSGISLSCIEDAIHLLHDSYQTSEETVLHEFALCCMEQALKEPNNSKALEAAADILFSSFEAHGTSEVDAVAAAQLKLLQTYNSSPVQPVLVRLLLFLCESNQYSGDFVFALLLLILQHILPVTWTAQRHDELVQELIGKLDCSSMDQLTSYLPAVEAVLETMSSAATFRSLFSSISVTTILPWCSTSGGLLSHVSHLRLFDLLALASVFVDVGCYA